MPRLFKGSFVVHCSSLMELLHCVWDSPQPTLHMARQDMELTGILRRTVENAASAVTNVRTLPVLVPCHTMCSLIPKPPVSLYRLSVPCHTSFLYDSCPTSTQAEGVVKSHPHSSPPMGTILPQCTLLPHSSHRSRGQLC